MKIALLQEAQALIANLPHGGKTVLAERLGWSTNKGRISQLAKGKEPRTNGGAKMREQLTQVAVLELRKMINEQSEQP